MKSLVRIFIALMLLLALAACCDENLQTPGTTESDSDEGPGYPVDLPDPNAHPETDMGTEVPAWEQVVDQTPQEQPSAPAEVEMVASQDAEEQDVGQAVDCIDLTDPNAHPQTDTGTEVSTREQVTDQTPQEQASEPEEVASQDAEEQDVVQAVDCIDLPDPNALPETDTGTEVSAWKQAVDQFQLPCYRQTFDEEGNRVYTSQHYKYTIPDLGPETDDLGKYKLHSLRMCHEQIRDFLGVDMYQGETLAWQHRIDQKSHGANCCGSAPDYAISARSSLENTQSWLDDDAYWKRPEIDYNVCQGGHEETHRFVLGTGIPRPFNEGLAQFTAHHFRDMPGSLAIANIERCEADGFYLKIPSFGFSSEEKIPFRKIDTSEFSAYPPIFGYYTATCFWEHVEQTYGHAAFQKIIRNLYLIADTPQQAFLQDAVYPVVGEGIKDYLRAMLEVVPD